MKKHLFTCFLALLCLAGSPPVLSQVVQSPGADFLHRSGPTVSPHSGDTHRGGGTLSDTFLEYNGAEVSIPPLHGSGPWTVDCGLNNPTTPSADNLTSASADNRTTLFFLEIPSALAADTLWLTYWDHFLEDSQELTPGTTIPLIASQGDFFQGNMGLNSYHWSPPQDQGPLFFRIRNRRTLLINTWTLFPGDQVRVRMDLTSGNSLFVGPSADFFRAQHRLAGLIESQKLQTHPLMATANSGRVLSDSATHHRFQSALALPDDLYPPMVFISPGSSDTALLDSILSQNLAQNPIIQSLDGLTAGLTQDQRNCIVQRAWGEILSANLSRLNLSKNLLRLPPNLQKFEVWKSSIRDLPRPITYEPAFLQAAYDLAVLEGQLYGHSLYTAVENRDPYLRDLILGRYLISGFRRKEGSQASSLQTGLELIGTPWIRELILDLQLTALPGASFNPAMLVDLQGEPFDLHQFEGKSLLISFWISGCRFCAKYYQNTLKAVFEEYSAREDIVFVSVNADTDDGYWREHLATGKYAHPDMINLHQDANTGLLQEYGISSFPQKLLIGPDFRLFLLTKNQYTPQELADLIESMSGENLSYSVSKPE